MSASGNSSDDDDDNQAQRDADWNQQQQRPVSKYAGMSQEQFWAAKKAERKERIRNRNKEKKEQQTREWDSLSPEQQQRVRDEAIQKHEERHRRQEQELEVCKARLAPAASTPTLVFDLQFAPSMTGKDAKSTLSQLKYAYSAMKRELFSLRPAFFFPLQQQQNNNNKKKDNDDGDDDGEVPPPPQKLSTSNGEHLFPLLQQYEGMRKFPPSFSPTSVATMNKETTIYLTADSPNLLGELSPGMSFVIGAFVDHNRAKGATLKFAEENGLKTARFPIDEALGSVGNKCKVLTITAVVDVLLAVVKHGDWKQALMDHLPTRADEKPGAAAAAAAAASGEELPARRDRNKNDDE